MFTSLHEPASFLRWKLLLKYSEYPTNTTNQRTAMSLNEPQSSELKRTWPSVTSSEDTGPYCQWVLPLLSFWSRKISSLFLHLASHSIPCQSGSNQIRITHQHTANCSPACPYHCCSPHVGGKALVMWIASSSGASASPFRSQDWEFCRTELSAFYCLTSATHKDQHQGVPRPAFSMFSFLCLVSFCYHPVSRFEIWGFPIFLLECSWFCIKHCKKRQ